MKPTHCVAAVALAALTAPLGANAQEQPGPLVTVDWLASRLGGDDLVLLHVGEKAEYDAGHIRGAHFITLSEIAAPRSSDPDAPALEMPDAEALRAKLVSLGVSDGTHIVVYFGGDWLTPATRVVFTLDQFGLGARAHLLDGGMPAWQAAGHPVTAELPSARPGSLRPLSAGSLVADAAFVNAHREAPGFKVVDARAAGFYDGVMSGGPRSGHIAGAVSVPFTELATDDIRIKPLAELEALFRAAGVEPGDTVIGYCHIGQQATVMLFGARLLGHPVLLYDGSFHEWSRRDDLPVINPAGGGDTPIRSNIGR